MTSVGTFSGVLGRRGDDHALRAGLEVVLGAFVVGEQAGRFDDVIDAAGPSTAARRVLDREHVARSCR